MRLSLRYDGFTLSVAFHSEVVLDRPPTDAPSFSERHAGVLQGRNIRFILKYIPLFEP